MLASSREAKHSSPPSRRFVGELGEPPAIRAQIDVPGRRAPLEHVELVGAHVKQRSRRVELLAPGQGMEPLPLPAGRKLQADGGGEMSGLCRRDRHGDRLGPVCHDTHELSSHFSSPNTLAVRVANEGGSWACPGQANCKPRKSGVAARPGARPRRSALHEKCYTKRGPDAAGLRSRQAVGEPVGDEHVLLVGAVGEAVVAVGVFGQCLVGARRAFVDATGALDAEDLVGGAMDDVQWASKSSEPLVDRASADRRSRVPGAGRRDRSSAASPRRSAGSGRGSRSGDRSRR